MNSCRLFYSVANGDSVKMSKTQSNKSLGCRQSSDIELKTIVDDNTASLLNVEKAIQIDSNSATVKHVRSKGINIKFRDIIYRARRNIIWDRCKYNKDYLKLLFICIFHVDLIMFANICRNCAQNEHNFTQIFTKFDSDLVICYACNALYR